jgi:sugar phosphate isomerase/epimerase
MSGMRIGCQTITFGDDQAKRFDEVFRVVASAGYDGVEIGYRRLAGTDFGQLRELLAKHGLELFASHIGGNLEDESQAAGERSLLAAILDDLAALDVDILMYSGLKFEHEEQFERDLSMVFRSARSAADRGVRLLYHNHNWEFRNGARVFRALVERGGPHLGFCPDVGWIFKGGADVIETLESVRERIGVVHFKEFASPGTGKATETVDTVEFGRGVVPLEAAAAWVIRNVADAWVVAEQDRSEIRPEDAVKANGTYLARLFREP